MKIGEIVRHAPSDAAAPRQIRPAARNGGPARPLNERGEAAARLMGGYMTRHALVPETHPLLAGAPHPRDACRRVAAMVGRRDTVFENRLYMASVQVDPVRDPRPEGAGRARCS